MLLTTNLFRQYDQLYVVDYSIAILSYSGFNRCSFQLLRSYKRHEENLELDRNVYILQAAGQVPISSAQSMNARKCSHACTKALLLSGIREWIKQGRRKRKERQERQRRGSRLMERKVAYTKKKPLWINLGFWCLLQNINFQYLIVRRKRKCTVETLLFKSSTKE